MYACLGVTCHLHFWQNDRGPLRAIVVTRGAERTPNKSQHTKLTLEKKILPPLLPGFDLSITSPVLYSAYSDAQTAYTDAQTVYSDAQTVCNDAQTVYSDAQSTVMQKQYTVIHKLCTVMHRVQ